MSDNSKMTWQQEEAMEREADRVKLFKGNQYCEGADPDHIYAAENFFRKFHFVAQLFAGLFALIGATENQFGKGLVIAVGILFISKWVCRWAARKGVEFLTK